MQAQRRFSKLARASSYLCLMLLLVALLGGCLRVKIDRTAADAGISSMQIRSLESSLSLYNALNPETPIRSLRQLYESGLTPGLDSFARPDSTVALKQAADIDDGADYILVNGSPRSPEDIVIQERYGFKAGKALAARASGDLTWVDAPAPPPGRIRPSNAIEAPVSIGSIFRPDAAPALWGLLALHHLVFGLCVHALSRRSRRNHAYWSWIPVLNLIQFCRASGKSGHAAWWFLVPVVNLVLFGRLWRIHARARGHSWWLVILAALPVTCLVGQVWLTFKGSSLAKTRAVTVRGAAGKNARSPKGPAAAAGNSTGFSLQLSNGKTIALTDGLDLTESHLPGLKASSGKTVARVIRTSRNPPVVVLQNLSTRTWGAGFTGGAKGQVQATQKVQLIKGCNFDFGGVRGKVQ